MSNQKSTKKNETAKVHVRATINHGGPDTPSDERYCYEPGVNVEIPAEHAAHWAKLGNVEVLAEKDSDKRETRTRKPSEKRG